jgi:hypothetical protein
MKYSVKLGDGRLGWRGHIQEMFKSLDEFEMNDENGVVSQRLGFKNSKATWEANPEVVRAPEIDGIYKANHKFT